MSTRNDRIQSHRFAARSLKFAVVSIAAFVAMTAAQASASAGTCGPNTILPDSWIPVDDWFEAGCAAHDECIGGEWGCMTIGACADARDDHFYGYCDDTYWWLDPRRALCYKVAYDYSLVSDASTCVLEYGCFESTAVGCEDDYPAMY